MVPWIKLDAARTPDGGEVSLWRRGDEFVVRAGSTELMSSRAGASEACLGEIGCSDLGARSKILVGGLGMGFTLRAALAILPASARVLVAELIPAVVGWLRGPLGGGALLDDPRVTVETRDAADILRASEARFDAVLLDVDNGPTALTQGSNRRLYDKAGLAAAARALRPGGRLCVWSAGDDPSFADRLAHARFTVSAHPVRARLQGGRARGARHVVFVGVLSGGSGSTKPGGAGSPLSRSS